MADVITRFKLETTQYDSKLRDAAKALADYAHGASFAGKEFDKFTKNNADAARALGNISTSATNAKDKVKELVGAYNQAANAYNALTKEQQQSDWGKALAESIQKLKGRITEAKQELYSMGDSGKSTGGIMAALKDKLTINIDALKLFNVGLQGAKAALGVAKDAFFASEASVDEWGRVMKSAEGLYEGFLNALNTGDISGYLDRMNDIVRAARAAYDEMDKLGTMKTIQSPQFSKQEAENNRMRTMLMTGRYIAPAEGSGQAAAKGLKTGDLLSPEQLRNIERHLQNGMNTIVDLTGREVKQTGKAIDAYYNSLAKQNGISQQEFRKGTSSWAEFTKRLEGAERYNAFERAHTTYDPVSGIGHRDRAVNPDAQYRGWDVFRVDKMGQNGFNDLVGLIKQQQQQQSQMYSTIGQAYRTINRAEGVTVKEIMGGGSGVGGGKSETVTPPPVSGSIDEQTMKVQELQKAWRAAADDDSRRKIKAEIEEQQYVLDRMTGKEAFDPSKMQEIKPVTVSVVPKVELPKIPDIEPLRMQIKAELDAQELKVDEQTLKTILQDSIQNKINGMNFQFAGLNEQIAKGIEVPEEKWQAILDQYNKLREQMGMEPIKINLETGNIDKVNSDAKATSKSMSQAASAISSVGSALQSIEDPSAKVMGIVAQAIATIAQSFAGALASDTTTKSNIWAFIGASAASMAAMVTAISQIHSATGYAEGGIVDGRAGGFVGGTAYSGDNIGNVRLDAGELVLNRSQQSNLANALEVGGGGGGYMPSHISGEQIWIAVNRYAKRTGKGELVTWK